MLDFNNDSAVYEVNGRLFTRNSSTVDEWKKQRYGQVEHAWQDWEKHFKSFLAWTYSP